MVPPVIGPNPLPMPAIRTLFPVICLVLHTALLAQCPTGNVTILSQEDADAFGSDYPNCTTLTGDLLISGQLITDLSAFTGVEVIEGDLRVDQLLGSPLDLTGFNGLTHIGGSLRVTNTLPLRDLQGLNALERIAGDLVVQACDSLKTLEGLSALRVVEGDLLIGNVSMTSVSGLDQLDTIGGDFIVNDVNGVLPGSLPSITLPADLDHVGGDMIIATGYTVSVQGATSLERIGGELQLGICFSLQSIGGFNALNAVGTDLRFYGNPSLTSITGFGELDSVPGELWVYGNWALGTVGGFPQLDHCGKMVIEGNTDLVSVTGFADLDSVGNVLINANDALADISAFDHPVGLGVLQITSNPELAICHVQAVCDRIAEFLSGPVIADNAAGCMNEGEVWPNCISTTVPSTTVPQWAVYPVPTAGTLHLSHPLTAPAQVLDRTGRAVLQTTLRQGQLDVRALASGLYYLHVIDAGVVYRVPFIRE